MKSLKMGPYPPTEEGTAQALSDYWRELTDWGNRDPDVRQFHVSCDDRERTITLTGYYAGETMPDGRTLR